MDLYAYSQIEKLGDIAKANGIDIPRLRGYRLMAHEEPVTEDEVYSLIDKQAIEEAVWLIRGDWMDGNAHEYSRRTDRNIAKYMIFGDVRYELGDEVFVSREPVKIRWDRIHGKRRKLLKWKIRRAEKKIWAQYAMWNQYAGQEGILYIHSRMGGWNWRYFTDKESIVNQPWFLGRVDDYWDGTYCDFYAKVTMPEETT